MKPDPRTLPLPENIASGMFLMVCSGENYETKVISGSKLIEAWEIAVFGEVGNADTEQVEDMHRTLSDPDNWSQNQDYGSTHYHEEVGETDRIDFYRMTETDPGKSETWAPVLEFAKRMHEKLWMNRHKGGRTNWLNADVMGLAGRILEEHVEMTEAMKNGDPEAVAYEAADIANFSMMVSDWFLERARVARKEGV